MTRVAGCDPGTSSLDVFILDGGRAIDQVRFPARDLAADPAAPVVWLRDRGPFDLVAGPSGYGLPLTHAADCGEREIALMTLVRPDEHGRAGGVAGFSALLRALCESGLPVVFLPGVVHLPTVPPHRKFNRIDMGTPDKLAVVALALHGRPGGTFALVEAGSAFSAVLAVEDGRVEDGLGGTSGPMGWLSGGAWDGELACLMSPLSKQDLFRGGASVIPDPRLRTAAFVESLLKAVAGLRSVVPFEEVILSGRLLETEPELAAGLRAEFQRRFRATELAHLPGAWVKAAAQGAALIADGLAGGPNAGLVDSLRLRGASGTVRDHVLHPTTSRT